MDFNSKNYQIIKLKKYFKSNDLFLLFQSAKLDSTNWTSTEQALKKLKLDYYKPLNKTTVKTLKNSIYKNYASSIAGFILFINPTYRSSELNLQSLLKSLSPSFTLLSLKLNDKIYSPAQLKGLQDLSYEKSMFNLHKVLDRQLKATYVLTNKNEISK